MTSTARRTTCFAPSLPAARQKAGYSGRTAAECRGLQALRSGNPVQGPFTPSGRVNFNPVRYPGI
jgi:hypothetical protein